MNVQIFDGFDDDVLQRAEVFSRSATPGCTDLAALAQADARKLRIIALDNDGDFKAYSCCFLEDKVTAGITLKTYSVYGSDFFDYNAIYSSESSTDTLMTEILKDAKANKADQIQLKNMIDTEFGSAFSTQIVSRSTRLFDKRLEEEGFRSLLKKKSLKRHINKCRRSFTYHCEHFLGHDIPDAELEALARYHIETRAFHHTSSAFLQRNTLKRYQAGKGNRLLTKIVVDGEPLAYHYGIRFGDTLIWHTPVINIKYYEYSPLEVLLYETISFCEEMDLDVLDLGIGDEPYKQRFSNSVRSIQSLLLPLSLKSKAVRRLRDLDSKLDVRSKISRLVRGVGQSPLSSWLMSSKRPNKSSDKESTSVTQLPSYDQIESFEKFVDLCRAHGVALKRQDHKDFKDSRRTCPN